MIKKVHIIGGGIIGSSIAYFLSSESDYDITVYEKDLSYGAASFARSCGGVRMQFYNEENIALSKYSSTFIRHTGIQFTGNGYLMLFDDEHKDDHDRAHELQKRNGVDVLSLDKDQLKKRFSWLNVDDIYRGSVTEKIEGWIDPVELHTWYKSRATRNGVKYTDQVKYETDGVIIIATGAWSNEVGKHYDIDIPIFKDKHTVFNIKTEADLVKDMPLVADHTGVYFRPEGIGYIAGYDGNGHPDDNLEVEWDSWDEVWGLLFQRSDIFSATKPFGAWSGFYDTCSIDNNPIIDRIGNVYIAGGFTGRGLMQSPAIGKIVTEMILEKEPTFNIEKYRLNRTPDVEKFVI